jgi:competence protein ComEA
VIRTGLAAWIASVIWVAAAYVPASAITVAQALPQGEGRETVEMICGDCHGPEVVGSQRRTKVEFETLIEDMASRSGAASDEQKKIILGYVLRHFGRVNVNIGTAEDIVQIVQLTAAEAAAIVAYREKSGEFKTLDDLRKVPSLDFARIQERKDRIGFTGP